MKRSISLLARNPGEREKFHLWISIAIALVLAVYHLCVSLIDPLRVVYESYTDLPLAEGIRNVLFLFLLVLLFVAHRRWRDSIEAENELERVIASISPDVLMVVGPDLVIRMCNAGIKAMYGYEIGDVVGKTTEMLYRDRRVIGYVGEIRDALEKNGFHIGTATGRRSNGQEFPLEIITGTLRGRPGVVILLRDITARRRTEQQLIVAKEAAETANRDKTEALVKLEQNYQQLKEMEAMRDRLMHMIVHDLKSPLSTAHGYLDLLEQSAGKKLDADEHVYLKEATKLTRLLHEMIMSLLNVHRLENKQMPLDLADCNLAELAADAARRSAPEAAHGAIRLLLPDQPVVVHCDRDVITRVMTNLLDNALKFSPPDQDVCLTVTASDDGARISVSDRGPGIPPEYREKIFERFAQVEARQYSTGLGLTFCKLAVEAHGGHISVDSEVGRGSTFRVDLPMQTRPVSPPQAPG